MAGLRKMLPVLSARETRVAHYLIANFPINGLGTVAEVAEASGVSTATVLRLVKRLGYAGYPQFQAELKSQLEIRLQSPLVRLERPEQADTDFLDSYFSDLAQAMQQMRSGLDRTIFDAIVELLADPKRDIHVLGGRCSGHVARYFVDLLISLRHKVYAVDADIHRHPAQLLGITRNSVVIVFDVRRYQEDLNNFACMAAERRAKIVLLTDPWLSPVSRVANHVLTFPIISPSIFDLMTGGMAVADALLGAVARASGEAGRERMERLEELRTEQRRILTDTV
ncbi:MurR/RpiR family transcriptional regulator [Paracoccus sp. SCSIO 75233]|uniref:MurR/RpiR family transcriptional regulator n=1 Tax=Paracoccus sp. SCSIO 75233 TaxID=3017782 RepID=UPI0022EFF0A5|nr:MurR/RpiR family transcriptional regulator [Paracoccus sp. SCSIO 75233]WBU54130.1 MurR/RpiR family transcriptional regulator [Paracoccus sp. SCSIO 75233]